MVKGKIQWVSGSVIKATGLADANMGDEVWVGDDQLIGEIVELNTDAAIIQVYEDTTGMKPGMLVKSLNNPLSIELGPGLIGATFDGIQRPLHQLAEKTGNFIRKGIKLPHLDRSKRWYFQPLVSVGEKVQTLGFLGQLKETELVNHKIMVPSEITGEITFIAPEGEYTLETVVAKVKTQKGEKELRMFQNWPIRTPRTTQYRKMPDEPLITGQRIIDFFFPLAKGGAASIPGGFGTGKTVTQHQLAKWSDADIIVYVGCGERGNEMTQVLEDFPKLKDPRTGRTLIERTVLIANTSNMPVAAREASIYTGITIAEYFRDMGYHVALMADSTSRWAEALREISSRLEEMPAEEGYPAYLASRLAEFYERAGNMEITGGRTGSVTIVGAVSPPGGDFSEPVTQHTSRFTRAFWGLDKELAGERHFPSINWNQSYSDYIPQVEGWWNSQNEHFSWSELRQQAMLILQEENSLQKVAKIIGADALPDNQRLVLEFARLIKGGFLQQNAFSSVDAYCSAEKQLFMMSIILDFYKRAKKLVESKIPVLTIMHIDVVREILRMKETISNEQPELVEQIQHKLHEQLGKLGGH